MNEINVISAFITEMDSIKVTLSFIEKEIDPPIEISCEEESVPINSIIKQKKANSIYTIHTKNVLDLSKEYYVKIEDNKYLIKKGSVVRTERFDELFFYEGQDLGANYTKEKTTFKVWSPIATKVELLMFSDWHDEDATVMKMNKEEKGIWSCVVDQDLDGVYYKYRLRIDEEWREAVDPYALTLSINGEKGMVIDLTKTNPSPWPLQTASIPVDEAIIYEVHIRDFTMDARSGVRNRGKYIGFIEKGTKGPGRQKTGLDYLIDLGITHVQLLPVQDFGSVDESKIDVDYNWGYDTEHYFSPEGSYATDPYKGEVRIQELKMLIQKLHENGLKVILDVVFNHVYVWERSHFENIVPGYYFRYHETGEVADGTGVGNDLASERLMVRKFIVDCVKYWAEEYKVDGFRFDLMGILDITTMILIRKTVDQIDKNIIILGEGWDLPTPLPKEEKAINANAKRLPGIAFFNDYFRDTIKGSTFLKHDKGFINGDVSKTPLLQNLITGGLDVGHLERSLFLHPMQSVNYIECHDNYTLWDKISFTNGNEDLETKKKIHRLGTAIVLLSQGIPFLHAGQEFYRTKYRVENSYKSPDVINQLEWLRKHEHSEATEYVKGLISIRKKHKAFRLESARDIRFHIKWLDAPSHVFAYMIDNLEGKDTWKRIIVIHNGSKHQVEIASPNKGAWNVVVDKLCASLEPIYTIDNPRITVDGINTLVVYQ